MGINLYSYRWQIFTLRRLCPFAKHQLDLPREAHYLQRFRQKSF